MIKGFADEETRPETGLFIAKRELKVLLTVRYGIFK